MKESPYRNEQPCLQDLTLSGFTSISVPCDQKLKHRLPHRAEVKDEATGKWIILTWREKRASSQEKF